MTLPMTIEDVLASTQVLEDVTNVSDSMTPEQAVEYRIACEKVLQAARLAVDMLNQQLVLRLDGQTEIIRDGFRYYVAPKTVKEVVDHEAVVRYAAGIAMQVVAEMFPDEPALEDATLAEAAAKAAVQIMAHLYLSPSTSVKKGQLDRYGIPRSVIDKQRGAKEVKKMPVGGET